MGWLGNAEHAVAAGTRDNPQAITHVLNVSDYLVLMPGEQDSGAFAEWVPIRDDGGDDVFGEEQSEHDYEVALRNDADARPRGFGTLCCWCKSLSDDCGRLAHALASLAACSIAGLRRRASAHCEPRGQAFGAARRLRKDA